MNVPKEQPFRLCWKDQIVGAVTGLEMVDLPWAGAKLVIETEEPELLAVLDWISQQVNSEDHLEDPPFREELGENWALMWPDGSKHDIILPCVDLTDSSIEFPAYALPPR